MQLYTKSGSLALTSVNFIPTTTSIHLQLNKSSQKEAGWHDKVDCLSYFVNSTLSNAVTQIEKTKDFTQLKDDMEMELMKAIDKNKGAGTRKNVSTKTLPSTSLTIPQLGNHLETPTNPPHIQEKNPMLMYVEDSDNANQNAHITDSLVSHDIAEKIDVDPKTNINNRTEVDAHVVDVAINEGAANSADEHQKETRNSEDKMSSPTITLQKQPRSPKQKKGKRCSDNCEELRKTLNCKITVLEKEKISLKQKLDTLEKHQETLRETIKSQKTLIREQQTSTQVHNNLAMMFLDEIVDDAESSTPLEQEEKVNQLKQAH